MSNISILEQQLAELRAKTSGIPLQVYQPIPEEIVETISETITSPQMITMSVDDLQKLIKDTIQAEIANGTIPVAKEITLDDALEIILTQEERLYFVTPEAMKKIPNFIVSLKGKGIVRQFVDEFFKGTN